MKTIVKNRITALFALALLALIAVSCANPLANKNEASDKTGNGGSLNLNIPAIAPGILEATRTETGRAFAFAYGVHFKLFDSVGNLKREDTLVASSPSTPISGIRMSEVPVGTGYRLDIEVFNPFVSETVPVVSGSATGINVTLNATTNVIVKCVPVNPAAVTLGSPVTLDLDDLAEAWYKADVVSGTTYYFTEETNDRAIGLFKADGSTIGWFNAFYSYTADYSGTLYIGAAQLPNPDDAGRATVLDTGTAVPILNEGSVASPVPLTVGESHRFTMGKNGSSYYTFTTGSAGTHCLTLAAAVPYSADLYSNAAFTASLENAYSIYDGVKLELAAGTTYYLKLTNESSADATIREGLLLDPAAFETIKLSDGSISEPVPLALGTSHACQIGALQYDRESYYTFTTNATDHDYSLSFLNAPGPVTVEWWMYGPAGFSSPYVKSGYLSGLGSSDVALAPSTTYYLRIQNESDGEQANFDLTLTARPQVYLEATPGTDWVSATVAAGQNAVWFKVPVGEGKGYSIYKDDANSGSGAMTALGTYSAFHADRLTSYYTYPGPAYASPAIVTIPSGESYLFVKFTPKYGTAGTLRLKVTERSDVSETITVGDTWKTGTISLDNDAVWYEFPVTAGTGYTVYMDNALEGSNTMTASPKLTVYAQNKTSSFASGYSAYDAPFMFTAQAGQTSAFLKLDSGSTLTSGTFAVKVLERSESTFDLTVGDEWSEGSIYYEDLAIWYRVPVTAGKRYAVYADNATEGSGSRTAKVAVAGYYANKSTMYFSGNPALYVTGQGLTVASGQTELYLKVTSNYSGGIGTYGIKVVELTDAVYDLAVGDTWTTGNVMVTQTVWYRVPVTEGQGYKVWWADELQGPSPNPYNGDLKVSAYRVNQTTAYFTDIDSGYSTPQNVTAIAGESYLYVKVIPYGSSYAGTYAIKVTAN